MKNLKMLSILAASVMFWGSCTDDQTDTSVVENPVKGGEEVLFGSSLSKSSQIETRTIYGDEVTEGGDYQHGYFPVYWEDGDNITILCPQASNGTRVDYTITPLEDDKTTSADVTKLDPDKAGLQWNGNVDEHEFFAFYPAEAIRGEAVPDDGIVTVNIPVEQDPVRWEKGMIKPGWALQILTMPICGPTIRLKKRDTTGHIYSVAFQAHDYRARNYGQRS